MGSALSSWAKIALAASILLLAGAAANNCMAQDTGAPECSSCHDVGQKMQKHVHASLGCATCHERHQQYPHPAGIAKPACATCHENAGAEHAGSVHGQELKKGNAAAPECVTCHGTAHEVVSAKSVAFRMKIPETCGMCHTDVAIQFQTSVHGQAVAKGISQAPVCTDCHGEHSILRHTDAASSVNSSHIRETCGSCHGDVRLARKFGFPPDRLVSFDASFHGLAAKAGSQTVAHCASCHGVHNILPSSDSRSTIHVRNLADTCGRCHPGAGSRFTIGPVHLTGARAEPSAVGWVRQFYLWLIPITIGLMLLHNAGDWARKLYRLRLARNRPRDKGKPAELRMFGFERVQHALLASSFIVLVWSGFALKFPGQWWARPMLHWEGSTAVRSVVHRAAAVIFIAVSVMHVISLITNRRLRQHWHELLPARRDVSEAADGFAYNLGLTSSPPALSPHSYIEKVEYWALVWGGVVMVLTGVVLWANGLALVWLPKSAVDVATAIHLYEAILATLAVLVWHFYFVIFDPEVYPLNTALVTGYSPGTEDSKPSEASEIPQETVAKT